MSQSLKFNEEQGIGVSQVIIQCPECQTKFSIDATAVDMTDSPRFHCSRCDHIFSMQEQSTKKSAPAQQELNLSADEPIKRPSLQPLRSSRQLEIPKRIDSTFRAQAPVERDETSQINLHFGASELLQVSSMAKPTAIQMSAVNAPVEDTFEVRDYGRIKNSPLTDDPLPQILRETIKSAPPAPAVALPTMPIIGGWKSFALPILIFLGAIVALSFYIRMDSEFAQDFRASLFPASYEAAPPELFIRGAKIRRLTLDSGELVNIVSGSVVNRSDRSFRDVMLEGALFDATGKTVATMRSHSGSALAHSRIKSLTPDLIAGLQLQRNAKRSSLAPGDSQEFALAFLGTSAEPNMSDGPARHYSVRVYSVKE